MGRWKAWIGRTQERRDWIGETLITRWAATLDRDPPADGAAPHGMCVGRFTRRRRYSSGTVH